MINAGKMIVRTHRAAELHGNPENPFYKPAHWPKHYTFARSRYSTEQAKLLMKEAILQAQEDGYEVEDLRSVEDQCDCKVMRRIKLGWVCLVHGRQGE